MESNIFRLCLRYFPVLTVQAVKAAPRGRYREGVGSGEKMIERFFLDGIDVHRAGISINKRVQFPIFVYMGSAAASGIGWQDAHIGAGKTADVPVPHFRLIIDLF